MLTVKQQLEVTAAKSEHYLAKEKTAKFISFDLENEGDVRGQFHRRLIAKSHLSLNSRRLYVQPFGCNNIKIEILTV